MISMFLLLLEICLSIHFKVDKGFWIFDMVRNPNSELFIENPYLVVSNRKNVDREFSKVRVKHNSKGYRGEETPLNSVIICAVGGSTTYGVGVDNEYTWPSKLDGLSGSDTSVVNLGVPGHSTVEHLVSVSLHLNELKPDIILLHTGLNDMRVSNILNIESDYSNFHAPNMYGITGHCYLEPLPHIASLYYTVLLMQYFDLYPVCPFHSNYAKANKIGGLDLHALGLYRENLKKLIHSCKYYTNEIVLIPQVLNEDRIKKDALKWWIPFIEEKELIHVLERYNQISKEVADSTGCKYLIKVDHTEWMADDFADPSHLNEKGNKKLAELIWEGIKTK